MSEGLDDLEICAMALVDGFIRGCGLGGICALIAMLLYHVTHTEGVPAVVWLIDACALAHVMIALVWRRGHETKP